MIPDIYLYEQPGADRLIEGFYLIQRRRAERVDIPVRIWFGPPLDEETGEPLDRSWRWNIQIAGMSLGEDEIRVGGLNVSNLSDFWPACARDEIEQSEYDDRIALAAWAAEHAPDDAFATPGGRIDPMTARLPFQ
jgi:hypothetical protein